MNVPEVCVTCVGELTCVSTCLHVHLDSEYAPGIGLWLELHQCWASQHLYNKSPARSYRCYVTLQSFTDTGVALPTMEAPFMGGGGWLIFCTGRWGWGTWVSLKLLLKVWKKKREHKGCRDKAIDVCMGYIQAQSTDFVFTAVIDIVGWFSPLNSISNEMISTKSSHAASQKKSNKVSIRARFQGMRLK